MRPAGEVRLALLKAAWELVTPDRGATLRELAHHSQVGLHAARDTVAHMRRAGQLCIARERKVPYRNRPVAEYVPRAEAPDPGPDRQDLHTWLCGWAKASAV